MPPRPPLHDGVRFPRSRALVARACNARTPVKTDYRARVVGGDAKITGTELGETVAFFPENLGDSLR